MGLARVSTIYGPCVGGPYDGKRLAHGLPAHAVTYERDRPNMAVPGVVEVTSPWHAMGAYVFHPMTESWRWFADIQTAPISPQAYALWITEPPVPVTTGA